LSLLASGQNRFQKAGPEQYGIFQIQSPQTLLPSLLLLSRHLQAVSGHQIQGTGPDVLPSLPWSLVSFVWHGLQQDPARH
jgi:hypothetical protein